MGNPNDLADAITYFQGAGATFVALLIVCVGFSTASSMVSKIPLIGGVFLFGVVLMILFLGLGFFFMTQYWGWSADAKLTIKYIYFGTVFLLLLWAYIWAHSPRR